MSFAKDPEIAAEWKKVTVKKAMNPCPIDFSEFHSSNPRAHTIQKEYDGQDHSNFNRRQKYADDEEPQFTTPFGEGPGFLPVEAGRYRLIWSRHCPWAHRIAIAIDLLGLDQVISKGVVDPLRPAGVVGDWFFTLDPDGVDPVLKVHSLGECYRKGNPHYDRAAPFLLLLMSQRALLSITTTTTLRRSWKRPGKNTSVLTHRIFIQKPCVMILMPSMTSSMLTSILQSTWQPLLPVRRIMNSTTIKSLTVWTGWKNVLVHGATYLAIPLPIRIFGFT